MLTTDTQTKQKITEESFLTKLKNIVGTTSHKEIGKLYLIFALVNFIMAGSLALLIRFEQISPGLDFVSSTDYTVLFSTHGVAMIFLVIFPMGAAFANYMIPILIKASDLYWPRWNNIAFWMLIPGALFIWIGLPNVGWTGYVPLSANPANASVNMWIIGLLILGVSSIIGSLNFIITIALMRDPKITWRKLDLFSWAFFITSFIQVFATPIISIGLVMLLLDRVIGAAFFSFSGINGPLLWQHVFWAYSHPAVYIMVLPAMGATSLLISKFSRKPIFGYSSMVISMIAIATLGFIVWGHHMFTSGLIPGVLIGFSSLTYVIAIPSGIKTFNWVTTLHAGYIKLEAPMLFALGFVIGFTLGGFTGIFVNIVPLDFVLHDTYFVVGHFHFIVIGGTVSALFGTIYYLFPHMTGRMYHKRAAFLHFVFWTLGFIMTFGSFSVLGTLGNPRRYADYTGLPNDGLVQFFHMIATFGALLMALGVLIFVINAIYSIIKGPDAGDNPWGFEGETINDLAPPMPSH